MIELVKHLFILQLKNNGITREIYDSLDANEKVLLEEHQNKYYLKESERKKIKVALTGGVFDVIHIGHVLTLNEAKRHCDILVVAVAADSHVRKKGREPIHAQEYRRTLVDSVKPVDIALTGFTDPKDMVRLVGPDIIIYGYDQKEFLRSPGVEVIKLVKKYDDSKFKTGKILERLGV